MKIFSYWNAIILSFTVFCIFWGCSVSNNNPKSISRVSAYPRVIEQAKKDKRYFVMHSGVDTFAITSLLVEKEKKEFTVHLNKIDSLHRVTINNPKLSGEKHIHVYMRDTESYTLDEPHTLPLSKVSRIELIN